jgi:hypothetical protein
MNIRYRVELSQAERGELTAMLSKGKRAARKLKRAQILLAADAGCSDEEIARPVAVGGSTVYRTKRCFVEGNLERRGARIRALGRSASSPVRRKPCWWQRLAQTLPKVEPAGRWNFWPTPWSSSPNTKACRARQCAGVWPKTVSSHGARICGAFHRSTANMSPAWKTCSTSMPKRPIANGRWSASTRARVQLIGEVRQPIPVEPGQLERYDCEYRRNGTVYLFVCIEVHRSWRKVKVHRTEDGRRLRPMHARTRRCPLSRCRVHPGRPGQPVDPFGRRPL